MGIDADAMAKFVMDRTDIQVEYTFSNTNLYFCLDSCFTAAELRRPGGGFVDCHAGSGSAVHATKQSRILVQSNIMGSDLFGRFPSGRIRKMKIFSVHCFCFPLRTNVESYSWTSFYHDTSPNSGNFFYSRKHTISGKQFL